MQYDSLLEKLRFERPRPPTHSRHVYHVYAVRLARRDEALKVLQDAPAHRFKVGEVCKAIDSANAGTGTAAASPGAAGDYIVILANGTLQNVVQPIAFGPIRSSGAMSVIQLFPYGRDAITRQVNQAVAAMDPALVAAGGLVGKSVALTGFPALERLLYDADGLPVTTRTPETAYACALAVAVARNLAGIAASILAEWQDSFRAVVLSAGEARSRHRSMGRRPCDGAAEGAEA